MNIGIIVAMSKELSLLLPLLQNHTTKKINGYEFHSGNIGNNIVVAMQCGIGKVNAALGTITLLNNFDIDMVINSGVAGGADQSINVMDIVVGKQVAYHDVYCGPESTIGAVQGLPLYYEGKTSLLQGIGDREDVKLGLICSGDQFVDTIEQVNKIKSTFPEALAVDMESAAIAQTCHLNNKDFLSIRVISDSPGANSDNAKQYENFWETAPQHTFQILNQILLTV